jgi:hypothetical protein
MQTARSFTTATALKRPTPASSYKPSTTSPPMRLLKPAPFSLLLVAFCSLVLAAEPFLDKQDLFIVGDDPAVQSLSTFRGLS